MRAGARVRRLRELLRKLFNLLNRQALRIRIVRAARVPPLPAVDGVLEPPARAVTPASTAAAVALEPLHLRAKLPPFLLQRVDHPLILRDVSLNRAHVGVDVRLDLLGAVRVLQGVHGVFVLVRAAGHRRHHDCPRVAAQTVFEDPRELGVAKRDEYEPFLLSLTKRVDAVGEGEERSVDVGAVAKLVPAVVGLRRALRARQVHERELTGGERLAVVVPFRASDCTGWWWRGHRSVLFGW